MSVILKVWVDIYQQTFVDTYSKIAFTKLYTTNTPITAADALNDKVLPFFKEQELPMLSILTDRGTEYCGRVDHHDYQLYLAINHIDHPKTKAMSPQTNGICERFHKTILNEFYQVTFREKLYSRGRIYKKIWTTGSNTITMTELIRVKCAVGKRLWKLYLMVKRFGLKRI